MHLLFIIILFIIYRLRRAKRTAPRAVEIHIYHHFVPGPTGETIDINPTGTTGTPAATGEFVNLRNIVPFKPRRAS
jgi:hypothetical protein